MLWCDSWTMPQKNFLEDNRDYDYNAGELLENIEFPEHIKVVQKIRELETEIINTTATLNFKQTQGLDWPEIREKTKAAQEVVRQLRQQIKALEHPELELILAYESPQMQAAFANWERDPENYVRRRLADAEQCQY